MPLRNAPEIIDRAEGPKRLFEAKLAERRAMMEQPNTAKKEEGVAVNAPSTSEFIPRNLDIKEPFEPLTDDEGKPVLNARGKPILARRAPARQFTVASALARKKGYKLKVDYAHRTYRLQALLFRKGLAKRTRLWNNPTTAKEIKIVRAAKAKYGSIAKWNRAMVAPPGHSAHETGAAIDLWAVPIGEELSRKHKNPQFKHIKVLKEVMLAAGFAPYKTEPWHWSIGDARWAVAKGVDRKLRYKSARKPFRKKPIRLAQLDKSR